MSPSSYAARPRFLDSIEGLRAVAAFGVMGTHIAFLTGIPATTIGGAILARADLFVAVFFALSAFLLWRRGPQPIRPYYRARATRILPAYWATIIFAFIAVPATATTDWLTWAATLTLTQIYLPHALAPALTHLWSMCVEVAFYLALPLLVRTRWWIVIVASIACLGWSWVVPDGAINTQLFPPAFAPWFAVGILAAEMEKRHWHIPHKWPWWVAAVLTLLAAAHMGPTGLIHPTPAEFTVRILAGCAVAALILFPYALNPTPSLLARPLPRFLGRISYSIFLIHLPVLEILMPIMGIAPFTGHALPLTLAAVPLTIAAAWLLYSLVEKPAHTTATTAAIPSKRTREESPA